jgi:hypothetical protein
MKASSTAFPKDRCQWVSAVAGHLQTAELPSVLSRSSMADT